MARKSSWSDEEDDILLATAGCSADDTNLRLMTAGYPARTDQQIKDRRTKVKARRKRAGPDTPLVRAIRRRDELEAEKEWVLAEIQAVSVELTRLLREELGGLDQSPEGD